MAKKTEKKSVAVATKKVAKREIWTGAQVLMGQVTPGSKEAKERELIKMTATVLNVSPFGVNILGSVPYINKLGLGQKSLQYGKGKDQFEYTWVQRALNDTDKAICECRIVRDGKSITGWVTGECSPKTMKMGTLAGYQNHMAQTRAKNRALLEAYGVEIHEEMIENIAKLVGGSQMTSTQANALLAHAGKSSSTSIEEVEPDKNAKSETISNDLFHYDTTDVSDSSDEPTHVCAKCDIPISATEAAYSKRLYGKQLCREHQEKAKAVLAAKKGKK